MDKISWENFATSGMNIEGIRAKFEALCRQLFIFEYLSENKEYRNVHCNPNNPGLESDPVYEEKNKRWIGFQAKYFDNRIKYEQIKESARKIVSHYSGKVDHVFLFCNKAITVTSNGFEEVKNILSCAGITIELITDSAILDLVRKYPELGLYYFKQHFISKEWINNHTQEIMQKLGERHNSNLNINTEASRFLSLFLNDKDAVEIINLKKKNLINEVKNIRLDYRKHTRYLENILECMKQILDIDSRSILESINWKDALINYISNDIRTIRQNIISLRKEYSDLLKLNDKTDTRDIKSIDIKMTKAKALKQQITELEMIINIPNLIDISPIENEFLKKKVLFIEGEAGVGKSHLLAEKTLSLLADNTYAVLLLGGDYLDDSAIQVQITNGLRIDCSFEEFIDILDVYGTEHECVVPIFIDAINETWNSHLWKVGLPSIINKIKNTSCVKLAISYRKDYKKIVIGEYASDDVVCFEHKGFEENSFEAARDFLNQYNIPFSPIYLFHSEITNPLFLTLYCKTYQGDYVDLNTLYERLLEKANDNLFAALPKQLQQIGYTSMTNLVVPVVKAIAENIILTGRKAIFKSDLTKLEVWREYNLPPHIIIQQLLHEGILHTFIYDGKEVCRFSYDQMNDYYCAKVIFEKHGRKELINYLREDLLGIENGEITLYQNIAVFVLVCSLYADKYREECIGIIDSIENQPDKTEVFFEYIKSFQWRKNAYLEANQLIEICKLNKIEPGTVWEVFISNSVRLNNNFNADELHKILIKYPLNIRDYLWTMYINGLIKDEDNRLIQLIKMYYAGEEFLLNSKKEVLLLLTLFGWCLSSSDRGTRDMTSKAIVEILKKNFSLCKEILYKFQDVNDPYIIQRLYGAVFGAVTKGGEINKEDYKQLVEYVYANIFDTDNVYPDILLRDYARLIVEYYINKYPEEAADFEYKKIVPPYKSEPIPEIGDKGYLSDRYTGGIYKIISSMRFEGMGMYGDFGRYIFQSALLYFDVDLMNVFNYAISYIINDLGYEEDMFGIYDGYIGHYDYNRHTVAKTERIGKKYQWIAMHNILARISDNCKMKNRYSYEQEDKQYNGPWEPFVRDFDPTLNSNCIQYPDAPVFNSVKMNLNEFIDAVKSVESDEYENWVRNDDKLFFDLQKKDLILSDNADRKWVVLLKYAESGLGPFEQNIICSWNWMYGFFVNTTQKDILCEYAESYDDVFDDTTFWIPSMYSIYNREYPWSAGSKELKDLMKIDYEIKTGRKEVVKQKMHRFVVNESDNPKNNDSDDEYYFDGDISFSIVYEDVEREVDIKESIGEIIYAAGELVWENEYDTSKDNSISFFVPHVDIVEAMKLKQLNYDGYYFDENGKIAAFDTIHTGQKTGLVIRKDILDAFLEKQALNLIWFVQGAKEFHPNGTYISSQSTWRGLYTYEHEKVDGEMRIIENN